MFHLSRSLTDILWWWDVSVWVHNCGSLWEPTGSFHHCLLLSSDFPAHLSVSRGLLWFCGFIDSWHNLCFDGIIWAEYFHVPQTLGEVPSVSLTEKAIFMFLIQKYRVLSHFLLWSFTSAGQQSSCIGKSWPPTTIPRQFVFQGSLS